MPKPRRAGGASLAASDAERALVAGSLGAPAGARLRALADFGLAVGLGALAALVALVAFASFPAFADAALGERAFFGAGCGSASP
jgi:hypothetical protein